MLVINPLKKLKFKYNVKKNYNTDSGFDLYVQEDVICKAKQTTFIKYGIACEIRKYKKFKLLYKLYKLLNLKNKIEYYCEPFLLMPRSSISKTPLIMSNSVGLIDSEYKGELISPVYNTSDLDYVVKEGSRLFQLVQKDLKSFNNIMLSDKLTKSNRGSNGFGSTGK